MYEERKTFDVLKGTVPDFANGDITLAYTIDGITGTEDFPTKESGLYGIKTECKNGATADWSNKYWGLINVKSNGNKRVVCNITFETNVLFRDYIISQVSEDEKLVKVEHETTEQTGENAKIDYRYTGSDPDNYVYFGCEEGCTDNNLYRIIGVMPTQSEINGDYENRVKLIKNNYYTENSSGLLTTSSTQYPGPGGKGYLWNTAGVNKWETSSLNTNVLNTIYWNTLKGGTINYQKYIDSVVWYLGAPYGPNLDITAEEYYISERGNNPGNSNGQLKMINNIGLMYPSDYSYSIEPTYWGQRIQSILSTYQTEAWMYNLDKKYFEWTISPNRGDAQIYAWYIAYTGSVSRMSTVNSNFYSYGIRPCFYLSNKVQYKSGGGTKGNPYRIIIEE